jgi:hypothetical protein
MKRVHAVQRRAGVCFPVRGQDFSFFHSVQTSSGAYPASNPMVSGDSASEGKWGRGVTLTTHLHLLPRSRMMVLYLHPQHVLLAWCSLTHGAEPFLRSRQLCSYSRTSQHFMELEGSLPCSQQPSIGPYPETDRSNPYHPISLRYTLILPTHLRLNGVVLN